MFDLSLEPFVLLFCRGEGYLNILILFLITITGSFSGMKIKQLLNRRKS
jgi:hypothetical protein